MEKPTKIAMFLTVILFLFSRLIKLNLLPLFNDEAIYINWGQIMINKEGMAFYSLFDGKQPFLMWFFGIFNKIIPDPLFAGRFVTVCFSFLTFYFLYLLGKENFSYLFSLLPPFLYTITPFFVFFDRQALMEGALNTVNILSLYFLNRYLTKDRLRSLIFLGIILGLGLFIKSTTAVFLLLSIALLIFRGLSVKEKPRLPPFIAVMALTITVFVIILPLIVQPNFKVIFTRGDRFNLTPKELLKLPVNTWVNNIFSLVEISFWHLTPPLFLMTVYGCWLVFKKRLNLLLFWFLGGIFISCLTIRGFTPRYVVSLLPLSGLLASFALVRFFKRSAFLGYVSLFLLSIPFLITFLLIFKPLVYFDLMASLAKHYSQKSDYVTGDTSGFGLNQVFYFLEEKAQKDKIIVGVRLDAGNPENAVLAYYFNHPKIKAVYFDRQMFPPNFDCSQIKIDLPIYFVSRSEHRGGLENYLVEEKKFYKPEEKSYFGIYRFKNKNNKQ